MKKAIILIFISLISLSFSSENESKQEFQESKFLQIDSIEIPAELKVIEDQIKQNAIDVILISKTHAPIYIQKKVTDPNSNYKNFYSLTMKTIKKSDKSEFYDLVLHYENWQSKKFDKNLTVQISRYNVLNETRFALYQLLLGDVFVKDFRDNIERQNFERIQAIRQDLEKQKRQDDLKKKKKNDELGKVTSPKKEEVKKKFTHLNPEQIKKLSEKNDTPIEVDNKNELNNGDFPIAGMAGTSIPYTSLLLAFSSFLSEYSTTTGLVDSKTNLRYIIFGARYALEQQIENPYGAQFTIKTGMPIIKENYKFPVYRSIETEFFKKKSSYDSKFILGLDFTPIFFVNLPNQGAGLQVFENDFLWSKIGFQYDGIFAGDKFNLRLLYSQSVLSKSNQKYTFSASKISGSSYLQLAPKHGVEFLYQSISVSGGLTSKISSVQLGYFYRFSNL